MYVYSFQRSKRAQGGGEEGYGGGGETVLFNI